MSYAASLFSWAIGHRVRFSIRVACNTRDYLFNEEGSDPLFGDAFCNTLTRR